MADLTVTNFFHIEEEVRPGLSVEGMPTTHDVRTCIASRGDVQAALRHIEGNYPELQEIMQVAIAMQVRLDTIRDETKMHLLFLKSKVLQGRTDEAAEAASSLIKYLGNWDQKHTLFIH